MACLIARGISGRYVCIRRCNIHVVGSGLGDTVPIPPTRGSAPFCSNSAVHEFGDTIACLNCISVWFRAHTSCKAGGGVAE